MPASGDEGEKCPLCAERFVGPSSLSKHLLKDHKVCGGITASIENWLFRSFFLLSLIDSVWLGEVAFEDRSINPLPYSKKIIIRWSISDTVSINHNCSQDERTYHFKCDECPRAYRSYDGMQKHQRIVSTVQLRQNYCGRSIEYDRTTIEIRDKGAVTPPNRGLRRSFWVR